MWDWLRIVCLSLITFNDVAISHLPLLLNVPSFVITHSVVEMVLWIMLREEEEEDSLETDIHLSWSCVYDLPIVGPSFHHHHFHYHHRPTDCSGKTVPRVLGSSVWPALDPVSHRGPRRTVIHRPVQTQKSVTKRGELDLCFIDTVSHYSHQSWIHFEGNG